MSFTVNVPDMSCQHCVQTIRRALADIPGVTSVNVDLDKKAVEIVGEASRDQVLAKIRSAGYHPQ